MNHKAIDDFYDKVKDKLENIRKRAQFKKEIDNLKKWYNIDYKKGEIKEITKTVSFEEKNKEYYFSIKSKKGEIEIALSEVLIGIKFLRLIMGEKIHLYYRDNALESKFLNKIYFVKKRKIPYFYIDSSGNTSTEYHTDEVLSAPCYHCLKILDIDYLQVDHANPAYHDEKDKNKIDRNRSRCLTLFRALNWIGCVIEPEGTSGRKTTSAKKIYEEFKKKCLENFSSYRKKPLDYENSVIVLNIQTEMNKTKNKDDKGNMERLELRLTNAKHNADITFYMENYFETLENSRIDYNISLATMNTFKYMDMDKNQKTTNYSNREEAKNKIRRIKYRSLQYKGMIILTLMKKYGNLDGIMEEFSNNVFNLRYSCKKCNTKQGAKSDAPNFRAAYKYYRENEGIKNRRDLDKTKKKSINDKIVSQKKKASMQHPSEKNTLDLKKNYDKNPRLKKSIQKQKKR